MKLSRRENVIVVDSSGVESTCITSTGGGKFSALACDSFTSTGALSAASISSTGAISGASISSTGQVTSFSVPLNFVENGSTLVNLKAYGVSLLDTSTSATTRKYYTLDAPVKGISKRLILSSTVAPTGSSNATVVNTGSTDIDIMTYNSTAINVDYTNVTLQSPYTVVDLMGISTSRWGLIDFKSASTNVTYTGLAGLSSGLSTGIVST